MKKHTTHSLQLAAILLLISLVSLSVLAAYSPDKPYDSQTQAEAEKAVRLLGPARGGIALVSDVRLIEGLGQGINASGLNLAASVEELNRALKDLNAEVSDTKIIIDLSADILFDFDKYDIKLAAEGELNKLAVVIKQKAKRVDIIGHTDSKGGEAYNQNLSLKRAQAVRDWLVQKAQISTTLLFAKGLGETQPVAPNIKSDGSDDPEGRAKNRRVQTVVQTKE